MLGNNTQLPWKASPSSLGFSKFRQGVCSRRGRGREVSLFSEQILCPAFGFRLRRQHRVMSMHLGIRQMQVQILNPTAVTFTIWGKFPYFLYYSFTCKMIWWVFAKCGFARSKYHNEYKAESILSSNKFRFLPSFPFMSAKRMDLS